MKLVTLAGIRAHRARLVAVSVAVILAVAFMASTLLLDSSSKATLRATLGESIAKADAVVANYGVTGAWNADISPDTVAAVSELPGVTEAAGLYETAVGVKSATKEQPFAMLQQLLPETLETAQLRDGHLPAHGGEVAIDADSLRLLGVELGDELRIVVDQPRPEALVGDDGETAIESSTVELPFTIVGVTEPTKNPSRSGMVGLLATAEGFTSVTQGQVLATNLLMMLDDPRALDDLRQSFATLDSSLWASEETLSANGLNKDDLGQPMIATPDEVVEELVNALTQDSAMLTAVLLAFVGIALFVAGLVISNTFSVLVAQRSRELALLRCIGASSRQVRSSVLVEALVMAVVASLIGVALAFGLMAGLIWLSESTGLAGGVGVFAASWQAIVLPLIAGVLVTLVAAQGPAKEATKVSPLEALRSRAAETTEGKGSRTRQIIGIVVLIVGAAVIAAGLVIGDPVMSLAIVLLGSVVSAVGILLLAAFVIPVLTRALGKLLFRGGVPGKLAAMNTVRNPKRTAATASALLVGVTLVATVYTGAEVARTTLAKELENSYPIDLAVVNYAENLADPDGALAGETEFDASDSETERDVNAAFDAMLEKLRSLDGIEAVVGATVVPIEMSDTAPIYEVWGLDPNDFSTVSRDADAVLRPGEALIGSEFEKGTTQVQLTGPSSTMTLKTAHAGAPRFTAIVDPVTFAELAGSGVPERYAGLLKLDDTLTNSQLVELRDEISELFPGAYVEGEAFERVTYDSIITMLLLIVTGLLAVAVVIAVIGIGNTLSLSVLERTRENALLRALGLTRGQLQAMLAAEAMLISLVSALLGVVLGLAYGFAGATAVLSSFGHVEYVVPWIAIAVIIAAALVAGLSASVLPARQAVKRSPVEGLAAH